MSNPQAPRGRTVRLADVITTTEHRGHGFGTLLVRDVIEWARSIEADRVDLSATPDGQRIYEQAGFVMSALHIGQVPAQDREHAQVGLCCLDLQATSRQKRGELAGTANSTCQDW